MNQGLKKKLINRSKKRMRAAKNHVRAVVEGIKKVSPILGFWKSNCLFLLQNTLKMENPSLIGVVSPGEDVVILSIIGDVAPEAWEFDIPTCYAEIAHIVLMSKSGIGFITLQDAEESIFDQFNRKFTPVS